MLPPSRPHSSSQPSDRALPPQHCQQRSSYTFPPSPSFGQLAQPSSQSSQPRSCDLSTTTTSAGMQDDTGYGQRSSWTGRRDGGGGDGVQSATISSRPSTSSSHRPPPSLPPTSPPLQPQHRPPSTNSTASHSSSHPFADPSTPYQQSQSSSSSIPGTSRQTFYSSPSLTSRSGPNLASVVAEPETGGQRNGVAGGNEAALGYDSLLGAPPPPSSSSSSSNGTNESNRSAQGGRSLFLGSEGAGPLQGAARRDGSPGERGMARSEAEEGLSGLGVSGWSGESRSGSGDGEGRISEGGERHSFSRPESAPRTTRTNDGLPDLPHQQQQQSLNQDWTGTHGSYFPQSTTDRERTHSAGQGGANYGSGGTFSGHPSSSSLASSAGLFSPLSPLVEPFSPSTTGSGGSATWGVSNKGCAAVRFYVCRPRDGATADARLSQTSNSINAPSSPLDLRGYPLQAQQQYQQQQQHQGLSSLAPRLSQSSLPAAQQSHSSLDRKFSSLTLGLGGVPEHGVPHSLNPSEPRIPSQLYGPNVQLGGAGITSSVAVNNALVLGSGQQYGSDPGDASYGGMSGGGGGYSVPMGASESRDSYLPSHGLPGARRDIPMDRGGYARGGYAEAAVRGGGASATAGSGSGGEGSEEISTIFVVGFPEDMLEREFQNMFVFSTGFEAATLKIPASTVAAREREREIAVAAVNAAVGGNVLKSAGGGPINLPGPVGMGVYQDPYGGMLGGPLDPGAYEDAFGNLPLDGPGSSLAHALGAASLAARESADSPASVRKQIIGFAKFRTRAQALDARDIISGKKVDAEKGNVLKAEMAKKNLHTKRGLSNELASGPGGPSFPLSSLDAATLGRLANASTLNPAVLAELARQSAAARLQGQLPSSVALPQDRETRAQMQQAAAFDAFHSVPPFPSSSSGRERELSGGSAAGFASNHSVSGMSREHHDEPNSPPLTSAAYYNLPRADPFRGYSRERAQGSSPPADYPGDLAHSPTSTQTSSPHLRSTMLQSAYSNRSMMQQLDDGVELQRSRAHTLPPPSQFNDRSADSHRFPASQYGHPQSGGSSSYGGADNYPLDERERERERPQPVYQFSPPSNPHLHQHGGVRMPLSPTSPLMSQSLSSNGIPRTQNPADMNAPKK